jgi:hypothetical protein
MRTSDDTSHDISISTNNPVILNAKKAWFIVWLKTSWALIEQSLMYFS